MEKDCPFTVYQCENCRYKMKRENITAKHDSYRCILNLKKLLMDAERESKDHQMKKQEAVIKLKTSL